MPKPKVAFYWCASCGGCEETVVDLAEDILGVVEKVDIILWPVAMDFKYKDIEAMPDKSITATLLNGAIRSTEQEEMARLLRRKSQFMIAYGSCACTGGIPGLANQFPREQILKFNYEDCPTVVNEKKTRPELAFTDGARTVSLPALHNVVRSLDQVVDVDYYVPGCPPTPKLTKAAVTALLENRLPPKGSVIAPDIALCDECPRKATKPTNIAFTEFKRRSASSPRASSAWGRAPAAVAKPLAPAAACLAPAASDLPRASATRASRSCPRSAPTCCRRKSLASTRCSKVSPIRSGPSTAMAWPRACYGGR
jgi:F420-non-reducing hydrogenase small subunit